MALFLLCALPVTVLTALFTPPGQSPDEPAHVARAAGLLHGAILAVRKPVLDPNTGQMEMLSGVKVNPGIMSAAIGVSTQLGSRLVVTADDAEEMLTQPPQPGRVFNDIPNTGRYFPLAYLPATLGLALGMLFAGGKPFVCFMLARFGMLTAFLALGLLALRVAAYGEALLLTVLLLPMSLFLAGTVNVDGVLIGLACLSAAALTRGFRWFGLLALVVLLLTIPPYLPLLGVFLLPLFAPGLLWRLRDVVLAVLPVLIWAGVVAVFVAVPFGKAPYHPGPLFLGDRTVLLDHVDPAANLNILLAQPLRFITMPLHEMVRGAAATLASTIGVLGPLRIILPDWYYGLWSAAGIVVLAGLLFSKRPKLLPVGTQAVNLVWTTALLFGNFVLILVASYISWTGVGFDHIEGMQGRYLLPLLPFLLYAVPSLRPRWHIPPLLPALPVVLLGLYDIGYIPMCLLNSYYLH